MTLQNDNFKWIGILVTVIISSLAQITLHERSVGRLENIAATNQENIKALQISGLMKVDQKSMEELNKALTLKVDKESFRPFTDAVTILVKSNTENLLTQQSIQNQLNIIQNNQVEKNKLLDKIVQDLEELKKRIK